jgi:hypothetical protein
MDASSSERASPPGDEWHPPAVYASVLATPAKDVKGQWGRGYVRR